MKTKGINEVDGVVAKVIDTSGQKDDHLITLSTDVVLRAKQASPSMMIRVMTARERPQPPTVFMQAMGREMENPDDPDYIARVQAWEMNYNNSMLNALIGLGTELVSKPKGMQGPNDKAWVEDYKAFGLPVHPESPSWRYITWIMYLAAPLDTDITQIGEVVKGLSGVREADVQSAETFPRSD